MPSSKHSISNYASPLILRPGTSYIFVGVFVIAYLGAMFSVLFLNWVWGYKIVVLLVIAISMIFTLRSRGVGSVRLLTWKEGSEWQLEFNDGNHYETKLLPSSFVSPWLVVLNFSAADKQPRRSVTLFRDALDKETFRRLRVRLGMEGTGKE